MATDGIMQTYNVELKFGSMNFEDEWKPVSFKEDGQRFQTSGSTMKLALDVKYVIDIKVEPTITFDWWWMDVQERRSKSTDLPIVASYPPLNLRNNTDGPYQYRALWQPKGLEPTPKGSRSVLNLYLQGSKFSISKQVQCKFYSKDDWHADYGHACGGIAFSCSLLTDGEMAIKDERFKLAKGYAQRRHGLTRANTI